MESGEMYEYTPVQWLQEVINKCANFLSLKERDSDEQELKKSYEGFSNAEKQFIHQLIREQFEINDGIYILSYLVGVLEIEEFWEDAAYNIAKGDFECITGCMLEIQLRSNDDIPYGLMRSIHRKNVECLAREIGCDFPFIPVEKRNKNRIVIITEQIRGMRHAPTAMTLQTVYTLQKKLGYEVLLLTCTSNRMLPPWLWLITIGYYGDEKGHRTIVYREENIDVYQYPLVKCELEDYRDMLSQIYEWNPLFVLNMGVNNPMADLPQKFTTVVERAMTTMAPVAEGDILVRSVRNSDEQEREVEEELAPYQKQIFLEKKFPVVFEETDKKYTRQELGLPENRFLVAIVGNRLETEIDEAFLEVMDRILHVNSQIDFVLIGQMCQIEKSSWGGEMEKRIHYLGFCPELFGVYQVLDLYLNPKRMGGGWSSAIALKAGLPVVTLPECDVAYNVGDRYVIRNYEEMIDTTIRYAVDVQFYNEQKQWALKRADEYGEDETVEYVTELVTKIQEAMKND